MTAPLETWDVAGVRIKLWPSRPAMQVKGDSVKRTQRWLPPHVTITYLLAPRFEEPAALLAVIDAIAAAGIALEAQLDEYHSGVLL